MKQYLIQQIWAFDTNIVQIVCMPGSEKDQELAIEEVNMKYKWMCLQRIA